MEKKSKVWLLISLTFNGGVLLLLLWRYVVLLRRAFDFHVHPAIKKLSLYGNVDEIISEVEDELTKEGVLDLSRSKDYQHYLTSRWYVQNDVLFAVPIEHFVWMYIQETKHSINFVAVGTVVTIEYYQLNDLQKRDYMPTSITIPEEKRLLFFQQIQERNPACFIGYNKEIHQQIENTPQDFLSDFNQRRIQHGLQPLFI